MQQSLSASKPSLRAGQVELTRNLLTNTINEGQISYQAVLFLDLSNVFR